MGSSVTTTNSGNVCLTATDGSQVTADAGGVAIAIAVGNGGQGDLTIGASVATNTVADTVHADITDSLVSASGSVSATAQTQANTDKTLSFQPSDVNTAKNQITLADHGLDTGDRVIYHSGGGAAAAIGGLVDGQSYYAIVIDDNTIELALTKAEALQATPTPIKLTSTGTGGGQNFTTLSPTIDALAIGGAASGAGGEGLTGTFAGAGAGAFEHRQQ